MAQLWNSKASVHSFMHTYIVLSCAGSPCSISHREISLISACGKKLVFPKMFMHVCEEQPNSTQNPRRTEIQIRNQESFVHYKVPASNVWVVILGTLKETSFITPLHSLLTISLYSWCSFHDRSCVSPPSQAKTGR